MVIRAVKLYDGGFMTQPFALGGEGAEGGGGVVHCTLIRRRREGSMGAD